MVTKNALYISYNVLSYMDSFLISTFEWFKTHPKLYVFVSSLEDPPPGRSLKYDNHNEQDNHKEYDYHKE